MLIPCVPSRRPFSDTLIFTKVQYLKSIGSMPTSWTWYMWPSCLDLACPSWSQSRSSTYLSCTSVRSFLSLTSIRDLPCMIKLWMKWLLTCSTVPQFSTASAHFGFSQISKSSETMLHQSKTNTYTQSVSICSVRASLSSRQDRSSFSLSSW